MQAALESRREEFDFVHLSNILDWLAPERAADTLQRARKALRPGGCVLVRQLNSSLDIRALGPHFDWQVEGARALHERDRSFFYRALHWGFKR
jgi:S-adenosylmethionine-diacylglycerol 3-amino-3-carboxypropyl transferase